MTDRLGRFTPNAPGLDRDAILFAAGRRSARGAWRWKAAAGLLAVSQAVTLVALWPMPTPEPAPLTVPTPPAVPMPEPELPAPSPPRSGVWTAAAGPEVLEAPSSPSTVQFVQSDPPLTVRSGLRID
jgi:hypothetical protein